MRIIEAARNVAQALHLRARSLGHGDLPRFLVRQAHALEEALQVERSVQADADGASIEELEAAAAVSRRAVAGLKEINTGQTICCDAFFYNGTHDRSCEEWKPSPEELERMGVRPSDLKRHDGRLPPTRTDAHGERVFVSASERWHVVADPESGQDIMIQDENQLVVATMPWGTDDEGTDVQLETAELMAAAPALADELQRLIGLLDHAVGPRPVDVDRARKVLADATRLRGRR